MQQETQAERRTFQMRTAAMLAPSSSSTRPRLSGATSSGPAGAGTNPSSRRSSSLSTRVRLSGSGLGAACRSSNATAACCDASASAPAYQLDSGRMSERMPAHGLAGRLQR